MGSMASVGTDVIANWPTQHVKNQKVSSTHAWLGLSPTNLHLPWVLTAPQLFVEHGSTQKQKQKIHRRLSTQCSFKIPLLAVVC